MNMINPIALNVEHQCSQCNMQKKKKTLGVT